MAEQVTESAVDCVFRLSKDYARMGTVAVDLNFVRQACERLLDPAVAKDIVQVEALTVGAAVVYCRCFRTTRRRIGLRAEAVKKLAQNESGIHEFVVRLRNEHLAHAGDARMETQEIYVGVETDMHGRPVRAVGTHVQAIKWIGPDNETIGRFRALVVRLLDDQIADLVALQKAVEETALQLTPIQLEELARREVPRPKLGINER